MPAKSKGHARVARFRLEEELCIDLARKRTERIKDRQRRVEAQRHYEQIAEAFYCPRPKPLSRPHQNGLNEAIDDYIHSVSDDELLLERDLRSVANDVRERTDVRQRAARDLDKLHAGISKRQAILHRNAIAATEPVSLFEAPWMRLRGRIEKSGFNAWFEHLGRAVKRYRRASFLRQRWVASMPLMDTIALEWLHDRDALRLFFAAIFARWQEFADPRSNRHKSVVLHQLLGSKTFRDDCAQKRFVPLRRIVEHLEEQGAIMPGQTAEQLYVALKTQQSRELSNCKTRRVRIRVTIR